MLFANYLSYISSEKKIEKEKLIIKDVDEAMRYNLDDLILEDDVSIIKKTENKNTFFKTILSSIEYEYRSLLNKPRFEDSLWGGVYAFTNFKNHIVFPVIEWMLKYQDAITFIACININNKNIKKHLGVGLKVLFFVFGIGDGFYRSFLNDDTLSAMWMVFNITSLLGVMNQFFKCKSIVGVCFNYLEKIFFSLGRYANNNIALSLHIVLPNIFLSIYLLLIKFCFEFNLSLLQEGAIIHFTYSDSNKMHFIATFNPFKVILKLLNLKKIYDLFNKYFMLIIFYNYFNYRNIISRFNHIGIMFMLNIKIFQLVISFDSQNGLQIILTFKKSDNTSLINLLEKQEKNLTIDL